MRALFTLILALILVVIILVGGVLAIIYFGFFAMSPAEYPFLQDASEIQSIEYAKFTYGNEGLVPEKVGIVLDTDGFMTELKTVDCHTGIGVSNLINLVEGRSIEGVIINYKDGSFDFITPYLCINSKYNPKGAMDLLNTKIYGFDEAKFGKVLEKYSIQIPTDALENFDGSLDSLPDGVLPDDFNPEDFNPEDFNPEDLVPQS